MGQRWVGGPGRFVPGIPARDLTDAEVERWPAVLDSPLWEDDGRPPDALELLDDEGELADGEEITDDTPADDAGDGED